MARIRTIKPEFWEDDKIAECSSNARLLFLALFNFADDEGYLEYRIRWLKAKCFPYDMLKIEPLIGELLKVGCLQLKNNILYVKNFRKHQKIDKPRLSTLSQEFNNSTNGREESGNGREESLCIGRDRIGGEGIGGELSPVGEPTPKEKMKTFLELVKSGGAGYDSFVYQLGSRFQEKDLPAELDKFVDYWTEKTQSGKERWQTEKTFEVDKRLNRWLSNSFGKKESGGVAIYHPPT